VTDFQYRYSFVLLLSYLFCTTIHTTQVNSIRPTITVIRESKLTRKSQRLFSCRISWKRSCSHPMHCPARSLQTYTFPDVHPSNEHRFICVPEFIHLPIKWTTHNLSTVYKLSAPQYILPMHNYSCSVSDHDNFLPAVIMIQSQCHSSQCTSTHSATEDVTVDTTYAHIPTYHLLAMWYQLLERHLRILAPLLHILAPCLKILVP
jgi:hypothetical protein